MTERATEAVRPGSGRRAHRSPRGLAGGLAGRKHRDKSDRRRPGEVPDRFDLDQHDHQARRPAGYGKRRNRVETMLGRLKDWPIVGETVPRTVS